MEAARPHWTMRIEIHGKDGVQAFGTPDITLDRLADAICEWEGWTRCGEGHAYGGCLPTSDNV